MPNCILCLYTGRQGSRDPRWSVLRKPPNQYPLCQDLTCQCEFNCHVSVDQIDFLSMMICNVQDITIAFLISPREGKDPCHKRQDRFQGQRYLLVPANIQWCQQRASRLSRGLKVPCCCFNLGTLLLIHSMTDRTCSSLSTILSLRQVSLG